MRNPKPCTIDGTAYPSQSAAAIALGLTKQRIYQIVTSSCPKKTTVKHRSHVTIDGTIYESIAAAASALGVSYWAARHLARLRRWPRRRKRRTGATRRSAPKQPPVRNAAKIIQRTVDTLATSVWIDRLPTAYQNEIARACQILQKQVDALLAPIEAAPPPDSRLRNGSLVERMPRLMEQLTPQAR
jgi:hypothetical protein